MVKDPLLDLLVRCLEKIKTIFSQIVALMVMNPMVESVKHHLKQTQVNLRRTPWANLPKELPVS